MQTTERSREALIEAGVLIPAQRSCNLLDITPVPTRGRTRNLSDVLNEIRNE
ncbi:antitoxin VapB47 [Mycobacterium avium subsp. avium 2285 (R)]|nr:antitoxin VapB47 [Mycobacterium avium subsp. avium 2285 (R)]